MKKLSTKKILLYSALLQLIMSALFYLYSFKVTHDNVQQDSSTEIIAEHLKQIDLEYETSKQVYEIKISDLEKQLAVSDSLLEKEKIVSAKSKNKVTELLARNWDALSPEEKSVDCDSLRQHVAVYVDEQGRKDSLYENTIDGLVALIDEKTLQIKMCDSSYVKIRDELNKSILDSKLCSEKLRKQRRQNRIFKIGAAVIASFTIGYMAK
jgi:hypothetical protein